MPENNVFRPNQLITIAVLVIALAAVFFVGQSLGDDNDDTPTPAASTNRNETFGVVTGGEATVSGTPDQLSFTATVRNTAAGNSAALTKSNRDVRAIIAAAKKHGVAGRDIKTPSISVQPDYDYSSRGTPRIIGYTATERVTIMVRKLGKAGTVLGAVTTAAGNAVSVGSISLSISNRDELVAKARTNAVKKSKAAAEALATAAGREVGQLEYVEEVTPQYGYPYAESAARQVSLDGIFKGSYSTPIRPGKQQVSVTVKVRWSLAG